ncbi:hypothetical protein CLV35_2291 [Motilibacter peucedani]|uniref:DUF5709 domain-containing protein n=1 Tax=Motilibacter peucedani TaxID=598650 RepID=A0A420XNM1_9ACTN|nr:hypothetical protein [Motilibacter peucedani]RKS73800.1 hypothetical protein CLV35_2291 [Motilibacter peucedani]
MSEDPSLHDMGGAIGPAPDFTAADPDGDEQGGYAREVDPSAVGQSPQDPEIAGSDRGGNANTPPVAGARSEYISIDDTDNLGRGADGETADRLEQQ